MAKNERVDVVIVGTGAAGSVLAKELSVAGMKVVAFEAGPFLRTRDFVQDELKSRLLGGFLRADGPDDWNTWRPDKKTPAIKGRFIHRGKVVGGGTVVYTGLSWRSHESDFKEKTLWGNLPGASVEDWPIDYWDLEPYYEKAEYETGVSGLAGANPFDAPRRKPYPLPPLPAKGSGALTDKAAAKLGWHSYPAPLAINSRPYDGRPACMYCGFCSGYGCTIRAKSSMLVSLIPKALATGRCEVRADCMVREVTVDPSGKAKSVIYFDPDGKEQEQAADIIILACSGVESPRLLLLSKSNLFPDGLANSSGLVGKNLMFNYYPTAYGLFDEPLNEYKSVLCTRIIQDFYEPNPDKWGVWGGGALEPRGVPEPIIYSLLDRLRPKGEPMWGLKHKRFQIDNFSRHMVVLGSIEVVPMQSNSVSLDDKLKDRYGLPVARITYSNHPDVFKLADFLREKCIMLLEAAGAKTVWANDNYQQRNGTHLMGTCRMGDDPNQSVLNKYNQSHDVKNLFAVDGSCFVTGVKSNPTLTIQALAYRTADYIIDQRKQQNL